MASAPLALGLAAAIIILGFVGDRLFKRIGVPDILILILIGLLLGPVLGLVDRSVFISIAPFFAALAIAVVLFDGGLNMRLRRVLKESPGALLLAILGFLASLAITSLFAALSLGWDPLRGLLLGAIVGGSSAAIVIPLITRIKDGERVLTLLSLESVFTDALVIVLAISLLQLLVEAAPIGVTIVVPAIVGRFIIGAMMGVVWGALWLRFFGGLAGEAYGDIFTLGLVLATYGASEGIGGSGAIAVLVFGLILGNGIEVSKMLKVEQVVGADRLMKRFQAELSFLMRTFFFVYLGLVASLNPFAFLLGFVLSLLLLIGRYVAVQATARYRSIDRSDRATVTLMMPRGLAAAVMAQITAASGIQGAEAYTDIATAVIVFTVLIATLGPNLSRMRVWGIRGLRLPFYAHAH